MALNRHLRPRSRCRLLGKSKTSRDPSLGLFFDPLLTWLSELARLVVPSADAMEVEHEVLADIRYA
jgi:hypothetical protein